MSSRSFEQSYDGPPAEIGVIGGSGFYEFLDDALRVELDTPFGAPSDALQVGRVGGRAVAFLPRHGRGHRLPPHRVNYRANLWALRATGVRQVIGPCAVGSLREENGPGTLVVLDQLVDRTSGRAGTFYDEPGHVVHVAFADPYCPHGRAAMLRAAADTQGRRPVDGGTLVVINGPRFSTRAESLWHQGQGWTVVGMTGAPEAGLARELALCYTAIALVTDHDAGLEHGDGVTHEEVLRVFGENIAGLRGLLTDAIALLPPRDDDCTCRHSLDGLTLPFPLP
ncbi:MAG: 5-methylthioadenosine phosphorylase [Actinomycetota bacterium]|jgi:5'-methylthioadenosine phosphorylase|nr:5-methylthioadenosine phosphorylase [Actinomycetota bacterium]